MVQFNRLWIAIPQSLTSVHLSNLSTYTRSMNTLVYMFVCLFVFYRVYHTLLFSETVSSVVNHTYTWNLWPDISFSIDINNPTSTCLAIQGATLDFTEWKLIKCHMNTIQKQIIQLGKTKGVHKYETTKIMLRGASYV